MKAVATTDTTAQGTLIKDALGNAMSYGAYRTLVAELAEQGSNTGAEQTESLANYTQLNHKRMKRWDKTFKLSEATKEKLEALSEKITWVVLTESWCGDAAPSLPVMNRLAELSPNLDLKVVLRDDNLPLMDAFLTNNARSIPKLVAVDSENQEVLGTWGPRPQVAAQLVTDHKNTHGKLTAEFREELQQWYNKDKGQEILNELLELFP